MRKIPCRFITAFCGSESSFAGLVDETVGLWNADIPKKISCRNLFYNLFVCLFVYFIVIYAVELVFFLNVFV